MAHVQTIPPAVDDLVANFSKLLLNASGDSNTLNKFHDMLNDELERVSNTSCSSMDGIKSKGMVTSAASECEENTKAHGPAPLASLVNHVKEFVSTATLKELNILQEVESIYQGEHFNKKYIWLSRTDAPLEWSGRSYNPHKLDNWVGLSTFMDKINKEQSLEFNSCLLVRYSPEDHGVGLHQDNESILDSNHPIVITSLGNPRLLEFWDSRCETNGNIVKQLLPNEGDLVIMEVGCQEKLWHRVLPNLNKSKTNNGIRYAVTFRKTAYVPPSLKTLSNGFHVHPNRMPLTLAPEPEEESPKIPSAPPISPPTVQHPSAPPITPNHSRSQDQMPSPFESSTPIIDSHNLPDRPKHLVIGDSMVIGLHIPGSVMICRGGIRPHEVLQLLPGSTDLLHPSDYDGIKTVTLVVGTNALNVYRPGKGMPLLDVVEDYEKLIHDLMTLFPNAKFRSI